MALYLVDENIDKTRSHYLSNTGKLTQMMRGVYVDATDYIDATILKHAVRIAKYLYPNAYLAAASATCWPRRATVDFSCPSDVASESALISRRVNPRRRVMP